MIGRFPAVLEGFVPFVREVSVVAARGTDGEFAAFDVCENEHRDHILAVTRVPAQLRPETAAVAIAAARSIGEALAMSASSRSRCSSPAKARTSA